MDGNWKEKCNIQTKAGKNRLIIGKYGQKLEGNKRKVWTYFGMDKNRTRGQHEIIGWKWLNNRDHTDKIWNKK